MEDVDKERLKYLNEAYKTYITHINSMFNYSILVLSILCNGLINSLSDDRLNSTIAPAVIATVSFMVSVIFWLIHLKGRQLLDTIEALLKGR
ncbi:hypothetical protein [Oryzibacter oryziterrae]|uniref:hypothetical protein n=1 Tax=Oryzibacter oryziterrae TaxID=2766474 RepID=UPI001F1C5675|nr:hypothetical protein [Oryzibacter oryziterrae]